MEFFEKLFTSGDFMPHGHCYFWKPDILWTHVLSDGLIGISYFVIPLCLIFIARRRQDQDIKYRWMLVLFGVFIYSCGATHLMSIITVWNPLYRLDGVIKVITAVSSIGTALALIRVTPVALKIPTAKAWLEVNEQLEIKQKQLQEKNKTLAQSEQALRESEERYNTLRDIFDSVIIQQDNKIEYVNPAAARLFKAPDAEALLGKSVLDFVHPAYKDEVNKRMQSLSAGERIPLTELKIIAMDGTEADIESVSVPFTYKNEPAIQVIIRDITGRKKQEKELRESEAKFKGLFESDMIGTMFWVDGVVTDANNALLNMIGYSREDMEKGLINWVNMTPEEYKDLDQEAYRQIMVTGIHAPYEKAYICKDGQRIPILVGGAFIKGYKDRGVSYVIDITGRKKREKALRESEAKFRSLFELDMLGVIFSDLQNNITDANDAFLKTLGYTREDLASGLLHWKKFTPPAYEEADQKAIESLRQTGMVAPYEKEYIRKDGTKVPVLIGAALLRDTQSVVAFVLNISERKEQEQKIRRSEARFKRLFESNLIGIKFSDATGNISEANDAFLNIIGYSRRELEQGFIEWNKLTPAEYVPIDEHAIALLETHQEVPAYEKEYIRKDGSRVSVLIGLASIEDHTDKTVSFMLDITERKKQEKELKESEAKFRGVFESDMIGIVFADAYGQILESNDAFLRIIGYSRQDQYQGQISWKNMTPSEYATMDVKGWEEMHNQGTMTPFEKEYIRKDGSRVTVLVGGSLLGGSSDQAVAFVLDITEQAKTRRELKQQTLELQLLNAELEESQEVLRLSESRFRRMFESDLIGIVFWDKGGNFMEVNNAFLQIIGYTREEWGRGEINWIKLTPPEYATLDQEKLAEMDANGLFLTYEKEYVRKDGSRVPILLGGARLEGFTDRVVSYVLDITNLKKVQQELEERARDLVRINEELEQFAYIASHDLQEPLRTMAGFANLLEKKYKNRLDQDANEFIEFIVDAAERMKKLITNLLEYSRLNTRDAPFGTVDFNRVVNKAVSQWQNKIQAGNIEVHIHNLPELYASELLISQLFYHLLSNAIKFRDERHLVITVEAEEKPVHWQFSVKDTGIGINMTYATRIFQVFQRLHTRDKYEGTGIGLAICKKIVEKHGGEIWVDSIPGEGSTFYFTLKK